jgi:hypothetical protein
MRRRVLLAAVLAPIVLGACDVGPRYPVSDTAPIPPPKYADVGAGICDRLNLPSLVLPIGEPGRVKEEVTNHREAEYVCRLDVDSDDRWYGAEVSVGVSLGEDSPDSAEIITGNIEFATTHEVKPISGWWSDGNEMVTTAPTDPPSDATWMYVHTRVVDSNLYVNISMTNQAVKGWVERAATTGLGTAVLRRLQQELEPAG